MLANVQGVKTDLLLRQRRAASNIRSHSDLWFSHRLSPVFRAPSFIFCMFCCRRFVGSVTFGDLCLASRARAFRSNNDHFPFPWRWINFSIWRSGRHTFCHHFATCASIHVNLAANPLVVRSAVLKQLSMILPNSCPCHLTFDS